MIRSFFTLSFILLAAWGCSGAQNANDLYSYGKVKQGKVIVKINGTEIHEGLLDVLSELNPRIKSQLSNPLTRQKILNSLVDQELLYQEAIKQNLDDDEAVELKAKLNKHVIVSNALLEKEMEKAMQKAYDEKKDSQFTKLGLSQIFVSAVPTTDGKIDPKAPPATPEQKGTALEKAKALKARLDQGEDFAKVASEASDDAATKSKGGKAGQISADDKRYARLGLSKVAASAFKLKNGQISDPIETDKGYYIVKITSDPIVTPFDEAKRMLGFELQNTIKTKLIEDLKKKAKVEFAATPDKDKPAEDKKAGPHVPVDHMHGDIHQTMTAPAPIAEPKASQPLPSEQPVTTPQAK